jgi:hypothetical protein
MSNRPRRRHRHRHIALDLLAAVYALGTDAIDCSDCVESVASMIAADMRASVGVDMTAAEVVEHARHLVAHGHVTADGLGSPPLGYRS